MKKPHRKVNAAGIGGALAVILVFVVEALGVEIPPEVAAAIATVCSFGLGYVVSET